MEYKAKVQEYRVSIRRKRIDERFASVRAKQAHSTLTPEQIPEAIRQITKIFEGRSKANLIKNLTVLKQFSLTPQTISVLKASFEILYEILCEVDEIASSTKSNSEQLHADLSTILINLTCYQVIDFNQELKNDIASPIIKNMAVRSRQINTIWFIANILYRNNLFSAHFIQIMIKDKLLPYLRTRMNMAFQSETQMTIFYIFVGSVAASMGRLSSFKDYKQVLGVLEDLCKSKNQQLYYHILDGMVIQASFFQQFNYQIFGTQILARCDQYCKNKRSRFVIKYLEIIASYLQGQNQVLKSTTDNSIKIQKRTQYERIKKYVIIKNLQFCLQNRLPEVKKLMFEIGYMLIALYIDEISFVDEFFYMELAEQIKGIQKYDQKLTIWMLRYFNITITSLLSSGNIGTNQEYSEAMVKFVQSTLFFDKIVYIIQTYSNSHQIINMCFDIIAFMHDYKIPSLIHCLKRTQLLPTLESLKLQNQQDNHKKIVLIDFLSWENISQAI